MTNWKVGRIGNGTNWKLLTNWKFWVNWKWLSELEILGELEIFPVILSLGEQAGCLRNFCR